MIPHLKKACQLNDTESALIDSAVYLGYFLMAIPAGLVMKRYGYNVMEKADNTLDKLMVEKDSVSPFQSIKATINGKDYNIID